jgi:hypothetical protein
MKMTGQLLSLATLPKEKDSTVPIEQEGRWAPEPVCTKYSKENSLPPPELELQASSS